jgi:hypothetical protein
MSQEIYLNPANEALIQKIIQQGTVYITDYIKEPSINQQMCSPLQIPGIVNPQKGSINMNGGGNPALLGGKQVVLPPNPARIVPPPPINKNSFYSLTNLLKLPKETYDIQALKDLGTIMIALQGDTGFQDPMSQKNSIFPALFTYIWQFLDNDLTLAPIPNLTDPINFTKLINKRNALFDLDSLFNSPAVYDNQGFLVLTPNVKGVLDVPRKPDGIQIIGDERNGENQIILQVHMLFMKFYNKSLKEIKIAKSSLTRNEQIELAKQTTRFHWQWLVINDFLKLACGPYFNSLFTSEGEPIFKNIKPDKLGALNGEFAFATYRWHSLPQELYYPNGVPPLNEHPIFSPNTAILQGFNGFRPLTQDLVLDFGFFWQIQNYNGFQQTHRFGTQVSFPLGNLPNPVKKDDVVNLPQRTLQQQNQCLFASGQNFARSFGITDENIINNFNLIDPNFMYNCILPIERVNQLQEYFKGNMPLFYYILYEARTIGQGCNLGPLGAMMIGQTFLAQLFSDPAAYVYTNFFPINGEFGCKKSYEYTFEDFIRYANDQPYPLKPIFTPDVYTNFFKVTQNFATDITVRDNFINWILKIVSTFTIKDKGKMLRIINNTRNSLSNITINVYNAMQTNIMEIIELDFQDRIIEIMWNGTGYVPYNNSINQ